jgi:hypothetical protein
MEGTDNATHKPVSIRELAQATGYTFEHIRKVTKDGGVFVSRPCNEAICRHLGLPAVETFQLAIEEKLKAKFGIQMGLANLECPDLPARLIDAWRQLNNADRVLVLRFIETLATSSRDQKNDLPTGA